MSKANGGGERGRGDYLMLDVETEGKRVTLITVCGPNEDTPEL